VKMHPDPWKFLADSGLLFELNRLVLHPLGLALVLQVDDDGVHTLSGLWDNRDDPEGICFAEETYAEGAEKFATFKRDNFVPRLPHRFHALGYIVQGQPGASIAYVRQTIDALLEATQDDDQAHGLALELLGQLDPGASIGLSAHWKEEGARLLIDLHGLQEEGWRLFGYMPNAPERGVLPLTPLLDWLHADPPAPPELPLPKLLGTMHAFTGPDRGFMAILPQLEPAQAVLARRVVAHPRTLIQSASEVYIDEAHGIQGGVVVRVQALLPREAREELDRDWGDAGGPGDRLIAEAARRATGLSAPIGVAEALAAMVRPCPILSSLTQGVNALGFALDVLKLSLWEKQQQVLGALDTHPRVLVTQGHKTGLTYAAAAATLWWFWNVEGGQVLVLGETERQLAVIFEPTRRALEVHYARERRPSTIMQRRFLYATKANAVEACEAVGHSPKTLIVADRAAHLGDEVGGAMLAAASSGARVLAFDVPFEARGWFHEASQDAGWHPMVVSAEEVPNVVANKTLIQGLATREWVEEKRREWGPDYANDPRYRSRVLGLFPLKDPR